MKTFDIALKYLKDIGLSKIDVYAGKPIDPTQGVGAEIDIQLKQYLADKENLVSNDYYRRMIFGAAIYHLIDLAQGRASYWNVACEIIESEEAILKTNFERWNNTNYPKVMVDKFIKYCNGLNPAPDFLSEKSEVRIEFFMSAFHYITDPVA